MKNLFKIFIVALFIGAILISPTLRREIKNHRLASIDECAALETQIRKFDEKLKKEPQKITLELLDESLLAAKKLSLKEKEALIHDTYCDYFQNRNEKEKLIEHAEKAYQLYSPLRSIEEKQNILVLWTENLILLGEERAEDQSFFQKARELTNLGIKAEKSYLKRRQDREARFQYFLAKLTLLDGNGSLKQAKEALLFAKQNIKDPITSSSIQLLLSEVAFLEGDLSSSSAFLESVDTANKVELTTEKLLLDAKIHFAQGDFIKAQEQIQKAKLLKKSSPFLERKIQEIFQDLQEVKKSSKEDF